MTDKSGNKKGDSHIELAKESLQQLLDDKRIPSSVRDLLQKDYSDLRNMLNKIEQGHLHIAVFGRVSVGKSSLLNALIGKDHFEISVLHGETKTENQQLWNEFETDGVYLIDTPGINEVDGEEREELAVTVANRADLLLFVVDSDLTNVELEALKIVSETKRPIILVINKSDLFYDDQLEILKASISGQTQGIIANENIITASAQRFEQTIIKVDDEGNETESVRVTPADIASVKARIWEIIEKEGKTLSALNASLFAGNISEQLGEKILKAKQSVGKEIIKKHCIAKGIAVALNPIPIADLLAAAAIDVSLVINLSKAYGLPMSKSEAGELIKTIAAQMLVLYGTFWAIHFASSVLKIGSIGLSTVLTGAAQGAVAWYGTLVVGQVAEEYLAKGKSWGDAGPKLTVENILDSLDKDSIMSNAKQEIKDYLKNSK